jgi:FtsH-binding integral membrane protein
MTRTELRAVPLAPVLGGTVLGLAALLVDGLVVPNGPGSALLWFALAGFATAAAFVLDEPSAAVVDAVPVPRRVRTAYRLLVALLPLTGWLLGTAAMAPAGAALSWAALAVTGTGFIAITFGAAAALRRSGHDSPGELVAAGAGGVVVLSLVVGVPKVGPLLEAYDASSRASTLWGALFVVAIALVVWGGSDPLTRWGHPYRGSRT